MIKWGTTSRLFECISAIRLYTMATVPANHASKDRGIKVWDAYSVNAGNNKSRERQKVKIIQRSVPVCPADLTLGFGAELLTTW